MPSLRFMLTQTWPVGKVAITPGPRTAFCEDFAIEIAGRGGHGARPHATVDPIATAAHLITLIYQAVPRQTDARQPVVVTIGVFNAGYASNVIPDTASLKGTIRTLNTAVATHAHETVERFAPRLPRLSARRFPCNSKV